MTVAVPAFTAHSDSHDEGHPGWIRRYVFSVDHKTIGIQFLFAGLAYFVLGGLLAMLLRWQLAWPGDPAHPVPILGKLLGWQNGNLPAEFYNIVLTMHATVMIFFVLIPLQVGAFGNYLIPLKIGARDMAFPFLNGLAFWMFVPAGTVLLAGVCLPGGGAATGWTAYPPVSAILYNGGGGEAARRMPGALSLLQVQHWNDPAEPVRLQPVSTVGIGDLFRLPPGSAPIKQIADSTWPALPIIVNFLAFFVLFAFIGTCLSPQAGSSEYLRTGLVVIGAALAGAIAVRALQIIAFDGQACWFVSLIIVGISSVIGAVNYLTTIVKMRCPGMTMFRLPLTIWNLLITSLMILFATPVLSSVLVMNLLDHHRLTSFFEPANWVLTSQIQSNAGGGYVLLDPHLFWFYSHPAVYIMILPVMGMVSDILPVFSRKPLFGYRPMVYASFAIAGLGFIVWGHHMFQSGMNPAMGEAFALSTMVIALPSAIKTFNWLATIWGGRLHLTVPMLNALAFVSLFVIGGLSGIVMASTSIDAQVHNTYYIVAHIHYVLFGGSTFGIFAAIYFWYPKMFGRMMNERLGQIHFVLSYVFFNGTFFAMHILGLQGMPRRVADYTNYSMWAHLKPMNQFITISAFGLMLSQIPFVINFLGSWIWGPEAPNNPWNATTLEWTNAPSPPGHGNFEAIPVVYHGPYEYAGPMVEEDFLAQSRKV